MQRREFLIGAAAIGTMGLVRPSFGQGGGVSFAGETIEILVPADVGGGSDVYARIFAPYWTKYLPGNPNVVIRNMPGGGQTVGANFFQAQGPTNGTMLYVTSGSTHLPYLLNDSRVRYRLSEWIPVSSSPNGAVAVVANELGVTSWEEAGDLQGQRLVFASQGANSQDLVHALSFEMLGLDVQHVFGFTGRGPGRVAFERREATIDVQTTPAYLSSMAPLVEEGSAIPLYALGVIDADGNIQRDPTFPDLPSFPELYEHIHGQAPSGEEFDVWRSMFISCFAAQKHNVLPTGTPPEIVDAYRAAAVEIVADPDFQAAASEELGAYDQFVGDAVEPVFEMTTGFSDDARQWIYDWLEDRFDVRI